MTSIYNHKQLQPQGAPNQPVQQSAVGLSSGHARLNETFDAIRQEFDAILQDTSILRSAKEEADAGLSAQVNELNIVRQALYQLENQHREIRQQYEEEIRQLRTDLNTVRQQQQQQQQQQAQQQPPPPPPAAGPPPTAVYPDTYYSRGRDLPDRDRDRDRDRERERAERERSERDRDRERDQRDAKRIKTERLKERPDHFSPNLSHPQPGSSKLPPGPPQGLTPFTPPGHGPTSASDLPNPPSGPGSSTALITSSGPNGSASSLFLDDLDPSTLPSELKKEGSDWFAAFNPKAKRVLDVSLVHTLAHESVVCCVRFSADGKYLATGCNQTAQIYDTKTGAKTCVLVDETADNTNDLYIRSVCFSPDGKLLATGAEDKTIRIWDIAKKRIRNTFQGHTQEIYSLAFSSDGRLIVSGSGDRTTRIWDMTDGSSKTLAITDLPDNVDAGVTSVAISSDGRLVAAGSLDTVVRIWDARTGELLERLRGHRDSVYSVAFTPDARGLVSGSLDKTLKYWDVSRLANGPGGRPNSPSASKRDSLNGKKDIGARGEGNSACTMNFTGHKDYVLSVAVSHDGQWVVSGSKDRGVQFWDAKTAIVQLMLQGHKNSVISIDLSPAGSVLATGSGDWQARIWNYTTVP